MESPYRPGVGARPAVFAGRGAQVQRAERMLAGVANSGEAAAAPLVLTGPRGMGKTVLLQVVREEAHQRGFETAHVFFDKRDGNHRALATVVAEAVRLDDGDSGVWPRIRERLAGLSIEVNAGVIKVSSEVEGPRTTPAATDRKHLAGLLVEAGRAATHQGRPGLAVFIDEVHEAPIEDLRTIATALQDLIQTPQTPVVVFMAGLPQTPEVLIDANSFAERFDYLALPRLTADAAHRVLLDPALSLGVRWAPAAVDEVVAAASGNPFMLQKLGHEAWLARSPTTDGDVIGVEDVRRAQEATAASLAGGMFRGRWAKTTPVERALLTGLAAVATPDGTATTADLAAATGRTTPQWSGARRSLIDKGLIEPSGHGALRFTMPTFAEFVRDITGIDHLGPGPTTPHQTSPAPALPRRPRPGDPGNPGAAPALPPPSP